MTSATVRWAILAAILFTGMPGCNYFRGSSSEDDTELSELDEIEKAEPAELTPAAITEAPRPQEGVLELHLKVGQRFPLSKTVEQRLTQTDQHGTSESISQSEMMLSLVVDELRPDGKKLMTVHYHRVKYQQDIGGKKVVYSSDRPADPVPPEAYLYAGLANNGFQFWLGPTNKVVEIVGFNDFLKRCLQNVPSKYAATVRQQLEGIKSEDGIANFVDDSIGLLPFSSDPDHPGVAVREGTRWKLEPRQTENPIPMLVTTECVVNELTDASAEILMMGRISGPDAPVTLKRPEGTIKVMVKGGQTTGKCRVDRNSGLPQESHVQRSLELAMELPDGQVVRQNKESISTIRSYLSQIGQSQDQTRHGIQQTNFRNADSRENHRRVIQAGGASQK